MPDDTHDDHVALVREFPVEYAQVGDGRTVDLRIVPFNTPTEVSDFGGPPYTETWLPGVFERQMRAANRVWLNFEHEPGLRGVVGHGVELVERDDALYGSFRVLAGEDGDKALEMVNEGLLPGVSLEAIPIRSQQRNGIVERIKARLDKVSLCRFPAFPEAQVLAVREGEPDLEPEPDPEPLPSIARNTDVDDILERVGYEPLVLRAVTHKPWSPASARFDDEQYERSCLVARSGDAPPKSRCSLPVLEPDGTINANALGAAAGRLSQTTGVTPAQRSAAARKLVRLYRQADMDPSEQLRAMAAR